MLYGILHAHLFLLPHCVPHREHTVTMAIRVCQTCCIMFTKIYTGSLVHIVGNLINCFAWQHAAHRMSLFKFVQCRLHILLRCFTVNTMNLLTTSKEADGRLQLMLGFYTLHATTILEISFCLFTDICHVQWMCCSLLVEILLEKWEHFCLNACFPASFIGIMNRVKNSVNCCSVMLRKRHMLSCHNWTDVHKMVLKNV